MIASFATPVGAVVPTPAAAPAKTSTPLAVSNVSSVTAEPLSVPDCRSSTDGWPPTGAPAAACSENVPLAPLAVTLNEPHRPASALIPAMNADASPAEPNWYTTWSNACAWAAKLLAAIAVSPNPVLPRWLTNVAQLTVARS